MTDNVVKLPGVRDLPKEPTAEEIDAFIDDLKESGPYKWVMGVAQRKDGALVPFNTLMDLRDMCLAQKFIDEIVRANLNQIVDTDD